MFKKLNISGSEEMFFGLRAKQNRTLSKKQMAAFSEHSSCPGFLSEKLFEKVTLESFCLTLSRKCRLFYEDGTLFVQ